MIVHRLAEMSFEFENLNKNEHFYLYIIENKLISLDFSWYCRFSLAMLVYVDCRFQGKVLFSVFYFFYKGTSSLYLFTVVI